MKPFTVSSSALLQARELGFTSQGPDLIRALWDMYSASTPFSHPNGNRRYIDFIFTVKNNQLTEISKLVTDPLEEKRRRKSRERLARRQERDEGLFDLTRP